MSNVEQFEEDYEKWCNCESTNKCNECDFIGNISQLDRITCSKICGYATFECDDCGSWKDGNVIIKNKLSSIRLKDYIKYILQNEDKCWLIWICNKCKKDDDEEKIIKNIDILLNSNSDECFTGVSTYYDNIGNQIAPTIIENDFPYNLKKIFY